MQHDKTGVACMRPVVGIVGNNYLIDEQYPVHASGQMNCEAIARASGAIPVVVPGNPDYASPEELMDLFDGFLLTGGRPNVHPEEYGEEATAAHGFFDRDRDGIALALIRGCVKRGQPVLGLCRGFQEFNVAFGGSLYPEIRDLPGRMNHRMPPDGTLDEKFALRHVVKFNEDSVFTRVFGSSEVMVNSLHGQGIKVPGDCVLIEGTAEDGTPEAIAVSSGTGFALAVQWHPEYRADKDPVSHSLFSAFGQALQRWHDEHKGRVQAMKTRGHSVCE